MWTWIVLFFFFFALIFGMIGGALRGLKRAIVRFIVVAAVFVVLVIFRQQLTVFLLELEIGGYSVKSLLANVGGEYANIIYPILAVIVGLLLFIVCFFVGCLLSLIVSGIISLFVKNKRDETGRLKKYTLGGFLVGALQGALVGIIYCSILTGLTVNMETVMNTEMTVDGNTTSLKAVVEEQAPDYTTFLDVESYNNSAVANLFKKTGFVYNMVETLELPNDEGKNVKYSLANQVASLKSISELATKLQTLPSIEIGEDGITAENKENLVNYIKAIGETVGELSEDAKQTVTTAIKTVAASALGDTDASKFIDFENFDLNKIDFNATADLMDDAFELKDLMESTTPPTEEQIQTAIESVVNDAIASGITSLLSEDIELDVKLDADVQKQVADKLNEKEAELDNFSAKDKAKIAKILGIDSSLLTSSSATA